MLKSLKSRPYAKILQSKPTTNSTIVGYGLYQFFEKERSNESLDHNLILKG